VQAEVGERIMADPNCKAYGPLSIIAQTFCTIETVARIGPQAFWPRPQVDSVMLKMFVQHSPWCENGFSHQHHNEVTRFAVLVRGAFEHRRKTLRSALAYVLDESALDRVCETFNASRRPEQVPVDEWLAISRAVL
jgi:16S rRNA (adenine1518-N6/adenine1519-N6)-dimethyltransferase